VRQTTDLPPERRSGIVGEPPRLAVLLVLLPALLLALILLWRAASAGSSAAAPSPAPSATPTAAPAARRSAAPTATPTLGPPPVPPTPTIDVTVVLARATVVARLFASTPTPTPYVTSTGGVPRRSDGPITLRIPRIGVNAPVEAVGLDPTGAMATPSTPFRVGWYAAGPLPGQPGNAVIDGHLDSARYGAAVFWNLSKLVPGDTVEVEMPGKRWLTFVVTRVAVYPYNNAPLDEIFGDAPEPRLNLITCSGTFDRASRNYDQRRVVYTRLVSARGG